MKKKKNNFEICVKIWINKNQQSFLGSGRILLLRSIKKNGSIRAAAKELNMSYKKAWDLINSMNKQTGHLLVEKKAGGKSGGGATLTVKGEKILQEYIKLEKKLQTQTNHLFKKMYIKILKGATFFFFLLILQSCVFSDKKTDSSPPSNELYVFCGAASKPPIEEIITIFEHQMGSKIYATFGGSGFLLTQMCLSQKGDIYLPGSSDFMEKAKNLGIIYPETERRLMYLIPELSVPKNNPKKISSLKDLAQPGVKVGIGHPENVCLGMYAVEIIENTLAEKEKKILKSNILNFAESCEKTANLVSFNMVDVAIGWNVFQHWDSVRIKNIRLHKDEIIRIGYIPVAISKFTKNKVLAQQFIDFLMSPAAKQVYRKYYYLTDTSEVFEYKDIDGCPIGHKSIGGFYQLPDTWLLK